MDILEGAPDALLYVYYAASPSDIYEDVGRTADISNNNNPDWPEKYKFTYTGGRDQVLYPRYKLRMNRKWVAYKLITYLK